MHCIIVITGLLPLAEQGMQEKLRNHHWHIHLIQGGGVCGSRLMESRVENSHILLIVGESSPTIVMFV